MSVATKNRIPQYTNGKAASKVVTYAVEDITPDMATEMLKKNKCNRALIPSWVAELAATMQAGQFAFNGETIIIDQYGNLLNGQHRLNAIVDSGVTIRILVVRGVDKSTFATMDQGRVRPLRTILELNGEENSTALSGAIQWLHRYRKNCMANTRKAGKLQSWQGLDLLNKNPGLRSSVEYGLSCKSLMGSGPATFLHFVGSEFSNKQANQFFKMLTGTAEASEDSPAHILRERLILNRGSRSKLTPLMLIAICTKAWNAFRTGEPIQVLRYNKGESFPEMA